VPTPPTVRQRRLQEQLHFVEASLGIELPSTAMVMASPVRRSSSLHPAFGLAVRYQMTSTHPEALPGDRLISHTASREQQT
jgi:hypothetical protein